MYIDAESLLENYVLINFIFTVFVFQIDMRVKLEYQGERR